MSITAKSIVASVAAMLAVIVLWSWHPAGAGMQYVAGKHGKICYVADSVSRSVKQRVYFSSYEECACFVSMGDKPCKR